MEHSNMSKAKQTTQPHVTPHHGNNNNNAAAKHQPTNSYVTPGNRAASTTTKKKQSFDPSVFAAVPAEKFQENANPQQTSTTTTPGLAFPPRLGTSYGNVNNNTTAATPSMFGANGTMSQALTMEQQSQSTTANTGSLAQSLKRKSESIDGGGASSVAAAKNPYSQMG